MRKTLIAAAILVALPAVAQTAKTPFTAVEQLTPEKAVRHVSGQELDTWEDQNQVTLGAGLKY